MNWEHFFSMGGYGVYVWSSYGVAAVILFFNLLIPLRHHKTVLQRLHEFYRLKRRTK